MYLNLVQIAESFGVSERVVEAWVRDENLPHTPEGGRLLFDRAQVTRWAATRGLAAQAGFLAPDALVVSGRRLEPLLRAGGIWRDVPAAGAIDVFERVVAALPGATPSIRRLIGQRMRARGGVAMAPVGGGFALPHPSAQVSLGRDSGSVALLFLCDPFRLDEPPADGVPITRLFFFIAPSPRAYLELLWRLGRALARGPLRERVEPVTADEEILRAISAADVLQ